MNNTKYYFFFLPLLIGGALLAQSPLENANATIRDESLFKADGEEQRQVPKLFEEENEDLGPQYLLLPGTPAHKWFTAMADFQWMRTSNPTYDTNSKSKATGLAVFTGQFGVITPKRTLFGGKLDASGGARYQIFRYGFVSDTEIYGLPVDINDFEAITFYSELNWRKENWQAGAGLRWTELDSPTQGGGFFEEVVPTWHLSRDFFLNADTKLQLKYDGAYYATKSDAFFGQFDDLNDRFSNSLSVKLLYRINPKLYLQPNARITYSHYENHNNGDREDTTMHLGTALTYQFRENIQFRLFTGYQKRESTGLGVIEYQSWNLGAGTTFSARF